MAEDNLYKVCREQCRTADYFYQCIEECQDKPVKDLVRKWYPDHVDDCTGFTKALQTATFHYTNAHLQQANTKKINASPGMKMPIYNYAMMPTAPYPPSPNTAPRGISNNKPDYAAVLEFKKGSDCYKYQFLAKARDRIELLKAQKARAAAGLGGVEDPVKPTFDWRFWVGVVGMGSAVFYFSRGK